MPQRRGGHNEAIITDTTFMKTLIEIINLKKDYYVGEVTVHALRGIDMKVSEGEFVSYNGRQRIRKIHYA